MIYDIYVINESYAVCGVDVSTRLDQPLQDAFVSDLTRNPDWRESILKQVRPDEIKYEHDYDITKT